jgi:hypothetical protein
MEQERLNYVVRDQDGDTIEPLDFLQAWGPPLRPPLRARMARWLIRLANGTYTPPAAAGLLCFLTCSPTGASRNRPGA